MKTFLRFALGCFLGTTLACSGDSSPQADPNRQAEAGRQSDQVRLPPEVVPIYGEAVAYRAQSSTNRTTWKVDLSFLIKESKVDQAVVVPYDADAWYEPARVPLTQNVLTVEVEPNRETLVALDLGEVARNNYHVLSQMTALKGSIPGELRPKICNLILCPPERFRANTITERLPDLTRSRIDFGRVMPPVDVGPIGRQATICDTCLEPPGNVLPCLIWKCGDFPFPVKRKVFVRRNVYTLSVADVDTLRKGVAAMKARPAKDPTSWIYQAKMHAVDSGAAAALQDQCQHRQFFFFSWHRMFTYFFEKILRKASGDPNFALPYWNYTDVPAQGVVPEPYRLPANATNALYNSTRQAIYNSGVALPAADVTYSAGFNLTNFTTGVAGSPSFGGLTVAAPAHFPSSPGSGRLEQSPHNNVHNDISGQMATGESPRDPVFWLHHANIDRLWKKWIALGNGRTNPKGDSTWMNHTFTFFDENGAQVSMTGSQILNTVTQLNYRYDDDPLVLWPYFWPYLAIDTKKLTEQRVTGSDVLADSKESVRLTDARKDVRIQLPAASRDMLTKSRAAKFERERIILQLRNIQYDQPVGVSYLLFLNLPADAKDPDYTSPNFIGTLGFFGKTEGPGHAGAREGGLSEDYDITDVVERLGSLDEVRVSVIPSYPRAPADRKDLQDLVSKLKPQGNPRFGQIVIIRQRIE
jgi:tyrosinase